MTTAGRQHEIEKDEDGAEGGIMITVREKEWIKKDGES